MARDRQRAKQRKARRAQNPGPDQSRPHPSKAPTPLDHNVPSELGHLGEVDEFEAAIVEGAGGRPADADDAADAFGEEEEPDAGRAAFGEAEEDDVDDATLEREAAAAAPRRETADAGAAHPPTRKGAGRFIAFLRASWAELQRVQWPDRRQVGQATGVVIGFVIVAGLYLGLADWVAKQVVNVII